MTQEAAEKAVELFEGHDYWSLTRALKIVEKEYHLDGKETKEVRHQAELLLTHELTEPERSVDVC